MRSRTWYPRKTVRNVLSSLAVGGVLLALALFARAGDFSTDKGSPEVPFTWNQSDIVKSNGSAVNLSYTFVGLDPDDELDALSYGDDMVEPAGVENFVNFDFSVDRMTVGGGGAVSSQASGNGAAGDKFRIIIFRNGRTVGPFLQSDATNHLLTAASSGTAESDLDAMSLPEGLTMPIYFSVDRAGSKALPTVGPADILVAPTTPTTSPLVFATAAQLGLDPSDNIDALALDDNGKKYELDDKDLVYVSLDRTSPTRAAFFGATDGVIRIWPKPARIELGATQLDLGSGNTEELNAMTARDPGGSHVAHDYTLWQPPGKVPYLALDVGGGMKFGRAWFRYDDGKDMANVAVATQDEAAGFVSYGDIADGLFHVEYTLGFDFDKGIAVGATIAGAELDSPSTEIGTPPQNFRFGGLSFGTNSVQAFCSVNGTNLGNVITYNDTSRLSVAMTYVPNQWFELATRARDEDEWDTVYRDTNIGKLDTPLGFGWGGARWQKGGRLYLTDLYMIGDLYPAHRPYLVQSKMARASLDGSLGALDSFQAEPDLDAAGEDLDDAIVLLQGHRIEFKKPQVQYEGGLVDAVENESEGPLLDGTPKKTVVKQYGKALKLALKARKLLSKTKPNAKKIGKQLQKSIQQAELADELLKAGRKGS
jgi:hypothetical protein